LDRPIFPECPLHAGTDSPAESRLGGGEAKWRYDRRICKNTLRGERCNLHRTVSGGRDLAGELILVACPSGAPLGIDHSLAQTIEGIADSTRCCRNEIGSRRSDASRANRSCDAGHSADQDRPFRLLTAVTTLWVRPGSVRLDANDPVPRELKIASD